MNDSSRSLKTRLFITCWLVFVLHFATDFVREHYLVMSIAEDFSFRLDKYAGLHPDIFVTPGRGAHHGANPGASMIAAIPYTVLRPITDTVVNYTKVQRSLSDQTPSYNDHRPARANFYKMAFERGLDIKFGLVGLVTMAFCMAPLSALGAVFMFSAVRRLGQSDRTALWMSLLYAFGTPVFFRTGYLNQNLMVGIFAFIGFFLIWQPGEKVDESFRLRYASAGFFGGLALLCDYSGGLILFILGLYCLARGTERTSLTQSLKDSMWYAVGAAGPVGVLWFYQWSSFGHPFYPPQHFMPPQTFSEFGYQGVGWPQLSLIWMLLFDLRFGIFVTSPILVLAFFAPLLRYYDKNTVPLRETFFILLIFASFTLFFGSIQYSRLQWITGVRYMIPVIPFLFLLTAAVLVQLPRTVSYPFSVLTIAVSWSMSMVRNVDVEQDGVMTNVVKVFQEGLQLPWLNTLSKMSLKYVPFLNDVNSVVLPLFLLWAFLIYMTWRIRLPGRPLRKYLKGEGHEGEHHKNKKGIDRRVVE